jgi:ADP-ribose pyrophosphatase YjhB (NUDIX family)
MDPRQVFTAYESDRAGPAPGFAFCPTCGQALTPQTDAAVARPTCPACGFVYYRNPMPGVVTLVEGKGHVLLAQRAPGAYGGGAWCLPGGFIEWTEDYLHAARREVREETGLEICIRSILSVVTNRLTPTLHTLVIVLHAAQVGGVLRPGDDAADVRWYPLGGPMPELAFEADRHIVERFAQSGPFGAPVDPEHAG